MTLEYQRFDVPVPGGTVTVGQWGSAPIVVVASHGITANHMSWQRVAEFVVERSKGAVALAGIDHRGRAGSAQHPGPFGLAAHADDLLAVADHLGQQSVHLVGHSMGAFVAALAAERHPARVTRLVLVDGGLPIPIDLPPDADIEAVVQSVIGPALDRLDQRWPDEAAYVDFFRAHPAFRPPNQWWPTVEAYVRYDAVSTNDGEVRSSAVKEAVLIDGGAAIVNPDSSTALARIDTPTTLLWAPRGLLDQTPGLFSPEQVATTADPLPHVHTVLVDDTNHYTIAVGDAGASAVADAVIAAPGQGAGAPA
ncbi:MAG: alpha/beta fold hydrolase [Actinomycetota bacterium]